MDSRRGRRILNFFCQRCVVNIRISGLRSVFGSRRPGFQEQIAMFKFLLWWVLLVICWPLALLAILLYPVVWVLLLPFRILGIAVEGVLGLVSAIILLPARVLRAV
jgi:hypothetical protein